MTAILGLDEDESFYRNSLRKLARVRGDVDDRPGPGFVIVQVDGLAEPILKNALRTGLMPFLSALVRDGSHTVGKWEALRAIHDQCRPDRHPPWQQRRHPRIPLVGTRPGIPDGLQPARGCIPHRAARVGTPRPAPRRRRQHLQPGVWRRTTVHRDHEPAVEPWPGHPDGELLAVPGQSLQHHPRPGYVRLTACWWSISRLDDSGPATSSRVSRGGCPSHSCEHRRPPCSRTCSPT